MQSHSISSLKYLDAIDLYQWIKQGHTSLGQPFQVIDVRGSDHIGGHIKGSWNYPYRRLKSDLNYVDTLRQELLDKAEIGADGAPEIINCVFHCAQSQQRGPSSAMLFLRSIPESQLNRFQIWVLKGGFNHWQSNYGLDEAVTENYKPDLW
ncbi:Ych1 [Kluyveromyces lactis]|nr:Ych1 [Kluyveromyces lactis]